MTVVSYEGKPIIQISPSSDGIEAKLVRKNFAPFALEKEFPAFRRKVSNKETALVFSLYWLKQNSFVPVQDFLVEDEVDFLKKR